MAEVVVVNMPLGQAVAAELTPNEPTEHEPPGVSGDGQVQPGCGDSSTVR